jgi:trans-2,3-dihydro-3-hydroxyanthranilate isomerase
MPTYRYRIVNVFNPDNSGALTGNPLAVFEDGTGLDTATMQALALQFNLSETTFITPSSTASANVRIFTPSFEMPFAGHPTLGTAQVVRSLYNTGDTVTLHMAAGIIPVTAKGSIWELKAGAPTSRKAASQAELAAMFRVDVSDIAGEPLWVDTGSEQLMMPLASNAAVARAAPTIEALVAHGSNAKRAGLVYVFAREGNQVTSRFFFNKQGGVVEDPGTGSAAANLGGYFVCTQTALPVNLTIHQGEATGRPCQIGLRVDAAGGIFVSGRVVELATGELKL